MLRIAPKIILALVFALSSCSYFDNYWNEHDFEIKNESSRKISFLINNYGNKIYSLEPNESINLQLYDNPNFMLMNNPRVYYKTGVSSACFHDMDSYNFEISNMCFYDVFLSEKNNLLSDTYGCIEVIPGATIQNPNGTSVVAGKKTVVVYKTSSPEFEAYYLDENNNKYDAVSFIAYHKVD